MVAAVKNRSVAQIVCTFPPYRGGMGKVAQENAKQAARQGYAVAVFTPRYKYLNQLPREEQVLGGVKVFRLRPFLEIGNGAVLPGLFWRLRRYDIYHLHYPFYGSLVAVVFAKIIWRKKLIIHYHMDNYASGLKGLIFRFYRFFFLPQILKLADRIVVHSRDYAFNCYASWWLRHWQKKIIEIPNGVDTNFYCPQPEAEMLKARARERQLLFVGSLDRAHYFKGLEVLFVALQNLRLENWHLLVVGNGDLVDHYKELVKRYHLEKKVSWKHDCTDQDLPMIYSQSYLTVLPSTTRGEAFGIVLLESMACRTPVVATALPGVRSVVRENINGLLARPGEAESLRTRLDYLLGHPQVAAEMGRAGYEIVQKDYSWQQIGVQLAELYRSL
jgi:glycosyltransferase involved in cell wall biosynthesis